MVKMKMKEPLCVSLLAFIMLVVTDPTGAEGRAEPWRNPDVSGTNLQQKMFTLSRYGGGLTLFAPYLDPLGSTSNPATSYPTDSSRPDPTRYYPWTTAPPTRGYPTTTTRFWPKTTGYYPWTTAPPTRGVSVCLRLITSDMNPSIFTLSPSSTPLSLQVTDGGWYLLRFGSNQLRLRPSVPIWPNIGRGMWTSVCLTVDFTKNVVQMFSNMNMSTRKLLMYGYQWSGEPVITFSGFDGQLTDVQVWDYPLRYKEVLYYMSHGYYGSVQGSLLTWSNIRYSLQGRSLLENSYEWQMKLPISKKRRGWALKRKVWQDFRQPVI
uniref:Pentraxin (PTX) domain-containing protein n=1 Tax=Oryzias latipes TaxID=8090 RepID=A0A3P9M481_ORYLA